MTAMNDPDTDPTPWTTRLDPAAVQIWREALEQLRHLSSQVWSGFKFFIGINLVLLALMAGLIIFAPFNRLAGPIILVTGALGIFLTLAGRYILKRDRVYYLQMLLKKSLLEDELGFYQIKFSGSETDLSLPWRLSPEVFAELRQNPAEWTARQIRGPGTIARWLFVTYEVLLAIYALALLSLLWLW
jgi:hypothetical protein